MGIGIVCSYDSSESLSNSTAVGVSAGEGEYNLDVRGGGMSTRE